MPDESVPSTGARGGRLSGEVVLVTGSTAGLGRAIAQRCSTEGAGVVVTGRDPERGRAMAASLGPTSTFIAADLADEAACDRLVGSTIEHFGRLTVLVNNAAASDHLAGDAPLMDLTTERWDAILTGTVTSAMWMIRAALRTMVPAERGSIVNISSRAAIRATPGLAGYIAAKGAMNALTRSVATDYAGRGVRCNTVSPGYVLNDVRDADLTPERRARLEAMHLTRLPVAEDVAHAVVYLASREAEVVTGAHLNVDGGSTIARAASFG